MATLAHQTVPQAHMERPRAVSNLSYTSQGSRRSRNSTKLELMESPQDKKRFNLEGKADPTKALNEATPGEIAQQAPSNLEDLRRTSWKDNDGNVITDPDRNNPSRPRMERPLDTIRGFAAAAEGTASRRSSSYGSYSNRPVSQYNSEPAHSRPGSYYNSPGYGPRSYGRQTPGGGYYRQNSYGFQGHSHGSFDEAAEYDHRDQYRPAPPRAGPGMRNMHPSNPYYGHPSESAEHATHQPSYETMTSGSDENGKSTNPSSLNSSYDQLHMAQHPHARKVDYYPHGHQNQYENETSHAPVSPVSPQNQGQGNAYGGVSPQYDYTQQNGGFYPRQYANPALPPKDYQSNGARKPIRLDGPPGAPSSGTANVLRNGDGNKRQSWLSRKFSRKEK